LANNKRFISESSALLREGIGASFNKLLQIQILKDNKNLTVALCGRADV
jgi:hypothetical protein